MRRLAVLGMLIALSSLALASPALAQEEGGGDGGGATTPDTAAPDAGSATPDAPAPDDAISEVVDCLPGGTTAGGGPCAAAAPAEADPTPPDPFSTISWEGTSYDTAPSPADAAALAAAGLAEKVGPIR